LFTGKHMVTKTKLNFPAQGSIYDQYNTSWDKFLAKVRLV